MIDFRPILMVVGLLLSALAIGMCVPALVDWRDGNGEWRVFAACAALTLFAGVGLTLTNRSAVSSLSLRQAFLMTTLSWVAITLFAALPMRYGELGLSLTDAVFEAMSGLTTTGATVIVGLDQAPRGLLIWRAILQWLGGIGIIVVAIVILPMLRIGGMQLFRMESTDRSDKAMPRVAQIASAIGAIYLGLSVVWAIAYWGAGMTPFEAIAHSMTTIATGGFSTSDVSIAHFDSALVDAIATLGMFLGGLPFILFLRAFQGDPRALAGDSQVRAFLLVILAAAGLMTIFLWFQKGYAPDQAVRFALFNVVSIISGTGYATADYYRWGAFAVPIFFFISFIGGCAGSTSCGIKVFRFQVLASAARAQIHTMLQPHGVFIPYYNRRPIPPDVITAVLSFFFVFGMCFSLLALGLGMTGLDFLTSVSGAASAIANVGPGLGPVIGPAGTYQPLPDAAKWMLAFGMLLGRLELFTVLVLFSRRFWKG